MRLWVPPWWRGGPAALYPANPPAIVLRPKGERGASQNVKPSDLYVGVLDLFSIFLPGAVVAWAAWLGLSADPALTAALPPGDVERGLAFLLAAFGAGHVLFLIASNLDALFDGFRKRLLLRAMPAARRAQNGAAFDAAAALRRAALGQPLDPAAGAAPGFGPWAQAALARVGVPPWPPGLAAPEPSNTYQWSRAVLRLRAPAAYTDVQRLEADSKFFRSLCLLFFLAAAAIPRASLPVGPAGLFVLAGLCFWRYGELRDKGIAEAYRAVIVLFTMPPFGAAEPSAPAVGSRGD